MQTTTQNKFSIMRDVAGERHVLLNPHGEVREFKSPKEAQQWIKRNIVSPKERRQLFIARKKK